MADSKITELTATTTPADSDVLPIVTDTGGSPVTKKVTVLNLIKTWLSNLTSNLEIGTSLSVAEDTIPTGAVAAFGGGIAVTDGAGGELSELTDDGGVSLYSGKYVTYQADTTNVAAGDVLFRVTANTIRRAALLDFAFVSYSALSLRAVIRIEVGALIGAGVVTVTNLQSTGAQLRYTTSNDGTNAFFDFYLQNTTPVDINAGDANNIVITTIPTRYGGVTVTFPNH